jgi:hypothetical protein
MKVAGTDLWVAHRLVADMRTGAFILPAMPVISIRRSAASA